MPPTAPPWIVSVSIDRDVVLPTGEEVGRDELHAWLWQRAGGLLGIDEGIVTVDEAVARGLAPSQLVIDAAAAPPDRDWVAGRAVAEVEWWFADEASARGGVALVAAVRGCRVRGIGAGAPVDHEALSRESFGPIAVPGFGLVRPAWEEGRAGITADGDLQIFVEPGLGFGTGLHETTQMCLADLADRRRRGQSLERVLDFGSGSGILGIAAAVLGAARVDAVEIDTTVHAALRANARRNEVDARLMLTAGLPPEPGAYDVVVANIVASVLVRHADELCRRVARGGQLTLSGLLADEVPAVAGRYAALLDTPPRTAERGRWRCLSFRRA